MRFISLIFSLIFLHSISNAQEVSLHLPVTIDGYVDSGKQCVSLGDNGYIILCGCNEPATDSLPEQCLGLLRLDASLTPVWSKTYHSYTDETGIKPNGTVMELIGDTVYVAVHVYKPSGKEIRMMAISLIDGTLLHQKDLLPQGATAYPACFCQSTNINKAIWASILHSPPVFCKLLPRSQSL